MIDQTNERHRLDSLFDELFPICRSITGPGLRESLDIVSEHIPLEQEAVPSGTQVFDWEVPPEWLIHGAQLTGPDGKVYADFEETNLAVVNYSEPVDTRLSLAELDSHLYTDPDVPDATPYVTSYYDQMWGFCLPQNVYEALPEGEYHAYIDSEFVDGELNYGHTVLPGRSEQEVLLSSYLCHPSLANNELSGPLTLTSLYRRIKAWEDRKYTYRFVLCPETIGSIAYLSRYGDHLTDNVIGGLVLTCLGGPNNHLCYKTTRREIALVDKTVRNIAQYAECDIEIQPFSPTSGSDERQYCSPGFNLPVGRMARTPPGTYREYHNSRDDKNFMGIDALIDSAEEIADLLRGFEVADRYTNTEPYGEPMLSKRDLYPSVNSPTRWETTDAAVKKQEFLDNILTILSYSDGERPMVEIANRIQTPVTRLTPAIDVLEEHDLLEEKTE